MVTVGFVFVVGAGMERTMSSLIHENKRQIVERLKQEILKDAKRDALSGMRGYAGALSLQDYCRAKGITCGSNLYWTVENRELENIPYKVIRIFERQPNGSGILLAEINTYPQVLELVQSIDDRLGLLCTELYRYQSTMREITKADLNFLARDEGACNYDGSNRIPTGANRVVEKELECTNGFVELTNFNGWKRVFGEQMLQGIYGSNTNEDVRRECGVDYGYVVIGIKFGNRDYKVCCGG